MEQMGQGHQLIRPKDMARNEAIAFSDAIKRAIESMMPEVDLPKRRVTEIKTKNISSDEKSHEGLVTNGINGKKRLKILDEDDQENNLPPDEGKRKGGINTAQKGNESMRAKITKENSNFFEEEK